MNEEQLTEKVMSKINLSKDKINLEKHVISLSKSVIDLSKKSNVDLSGITAQVVVVLDYSGSMSSLYNNGTVQQTLNRLIPLGLTFDDNGAVEVFLFQNDFRQMSAMNLSNYADYIDAVVRKSSYTMGGTCYAPVLDAVINGAKVSQTETVETKGLFGFKKNKEVVKLVHQPGLVNDAVPTYVLFITDGANSDETKTTKLLQSVCEKNVFIQFVGIGNDSFRYLEQLDTLPNRSRDNTGFCRMSDLTAIPDDVLYTKVLEEFANWLKGKQ